MVDRYKWNSRIHEYINSSGDECAAVSVISASDYDALAAELAEVESAGEYALKQKDDRIRALKAALREARRWIGDGEYGDGLHRDHWTPEYKSVVDLVDAALREAK